MIAQFDPEFASPADFADLYRSIGMQVVPAKDPRQTPAGQAWKRPLVAWKQFEHELASDVQHAAWFGQGGEFASHQNMGLIAGVGRWFVVDLDTHKHPEAEQWWDTLMLVHNNGLPLETPTQRTGGGGLQIFLFAPDGWRPPTGATAIGVDFRGEGGFAVLPPSMHESGAVYRWVDGLEPWEMEPEVAPEWLCAAIDALLAQYGSHPLQRVAKASSASPLPMPFSLSGKLLDGREAFMTRVIWAVLVSEYRDCPIPPTAAEGEALMLSAFQTYLSGVASRLRRDCRTKEDLLEEEGRGISAFREKWRRARAQWDGRVADDAAIPPNRASDGTGIIPTHPEDGQAEAPLAQASADLQEAGENFFRRAAPIAVARQRHRAAAKGAIGVLPEDWGGDPPQGEVGLITASLGLGKTEAYISAILKLLDGDFSGPEQFDAPLAPFLVEIRVLDHGIAEDLEARLNARRAGVASIWRGMEQPSSSGLGTMCQRIEDAKAWRSAGGTLGSLCSRCPHGRKGDNDCEYLDQKVATPVIILATPGGVTAGSVQALKRRVRVPGLDELVTFGADIVIVDETRPTSWVGGVEGRRYVVGADTFAGKFRPPGDAVKMSADDCFILDDEISRLENLVRSALAPLLPGHSAFLTVADLQRVFKTADGWRALRAKALKLTIRPDLKFAGLTGEALRTAISAAHVWNTRVLKVARLALVAADAIDAATDGAGAVDPSAPCAQIEAVNGTSDGTGLALVWRERASPTVLGKPILVLDATGDAELLGRWLPDLRLICDARALLPESCVRVVQVADSICGYTSWSPSSVTGSQSKSAITKRSTAKANVLRLAHFIDYLCSRADGQGVGVIVPKGTREALEEIWEGRPAGHPPNMKLGHYNAIAGLDTMRDVRFLLLWSRPSPRPEQVERIARAIGGRAVETVDEWFDRGGHQYRMRDGRHEPAIKSECHPDALAERVRRQTTDAELEQAAGRARAIRRTAETPLTVIIGTAQPTSLPVDELVTVDGLLQLGPIEALEARGITVPTGSNNKSYVEVLQAATGMSADAIRSHVKRLNVSGSYKTPIGLGHVEAAYCPPPPVEFRLTLRGSRYSPTIWLRHDLADDPASALAAEGITPERIERIHPLSPAQQPSRAMILDFFRRHADDVVAAGGEGCYGKAVLEEDPHLLVSRPEWAHTVLQVGAQLLRVRGTV